jgi:isocitrate/isopropylmalate dehydrogenase
VQTSRQIRKFEPVHGSRKVHGHDRANPIAPKCQWRWMEHLGEREAANKIEQSVTQFHSEGKVKTQVHDGTETTSDMADAVAQKIS